MRCKCEKCHYNEDGYCREPDYVVVDNNGKCESLFIKQDPENELVSVHSHDMKCSVGDTLYVLSPNSPTGIDEAKCKRIGSGWTDRAGYTTVYYVQVGQDDSKPRWKFHNWDFGVSVFLTINEAEDVLAQNNTAPCHVGDSIPYQLHGGRMIYYIVEKIKTKSDGTIMIRCKHGGGGANRSFTVREVRNLIQNKGKVSD